MGRKSKNGEIPTGLPGGFFIYESGGNDEILFADENPEIYLEIHS